MDTLLECVYNDDTNRVCEIINFYDNNLLRTIVLYSKSVKMIQIIDNYAQLTTLDFCKIIQYTSVISVVDYILKYHFKNNLKNPLIIKNSKIIFKNKSVTIIKYLINKLEWINYKEIYNITESEEIARYILHISKDKSMYGSTADKIFSYINKAADCNFKLNNAKTDVEILQMLLDHTCKIKWHNKYISLRIAKILFALNYNKYEALWETQSEEIINYLLDKYITLYPTELINHCFTKCSQVIVSKWFNKLKHSEYIDTGLLNYCIQASDDDNNTTHQYISTRDLEHAFEHGLNLTNINIHDLYKHFKIHIQTYFKTYLNKIYLLLATTDSIDIIEFIINNIHDLIE